jgi:hypothetical protein
MARKRGILRVAMGALASLLVLHGAAMGDQERLPTCEKDRLLRIAPRDIDAVIVVNSAARQRASSGGRALHALLMEADALPETRAAWGELSRVLDWPEERAFDELLGRRITLVMRGLESPTPQWAVLSEVSAATERRLRERLRPAPRMNIAGLLTHSIENGRYNLVVGPSQAGGDARPRAPGDTGALILLGPGGDNRLLSELAPMLLGPMPAPPAGPGGRECDFVVVLNQVKSQRYLLITGTHDEAGWNMHLAASPGMVWGRPEGVESIKPWSASAFGTLERHALLAVMGVIGSARLEGITAVHALPQLPVIPWNLAGEPFGQRAAFYIREEQVAGAPARLSEGLANGAGGSARVSDASAGSQEDTSRFSLGLAIETTDARQMLLEGDQIVARLIPLLEDGRIQEQQAQRVQLVVAVPDAAVRMLRLPVPWLNSIVGPEPTVSWGVRAGPDGTDGPGWWLAAVSPAGASTVEQDVSALAMADQAPAGRMLPRLSMGVVRPAALERTAAQVDPGFLAPLRGMRWVETIRWDAWQCDDGTVEATIRLRMVGGAN